MDRSQARKSLSLAAPQPCARLGWLSGAPQTRAPTLHPDTAAGPVPSTARQVLPLAAAPAAPTVCLRN